MILPWLVYGTAVGLLVAAAAWLLERPLAQRRLPVRWLWIAALAALLAIPGLVLTLPDPIVSMPPPTPTATAWPAGTLAPAVPVSRQLVIEPLTLPPITPPTFDLDRWILMAWAFCSGAIALSLLIAYGALLRRRGAWEKREVDGRTVWVSPNTGPAVVGIFPGRVVVPEWLLHAPSQDRALILAHEEEHILAGDARLLAAVLLVWVALPWNPALWWIWRALRRAVEIDCDARVLARGVDPRAYGRVLLDVTERGTAHRFAVAALSESHSFLERRIRLMITKSTPRWGPRAAGALVLSIACVATACRMDQPQHQPIVATGITMAPTQAVPPGEPSTPVDLVTAVLDPGSATPDNMTRAVKTTFRSIIETRHPEVASGALRAERIYLYVAIDGNGDVLASEIDTERRSGSCSTILVAGLGRELDRDQYDMGGCGSLDAGEAGPSPISFFWQSSKPATEQERIAPTGDYLLARILRRGRPSLQSIAAAVQEHHPEVYREGLSQGETLWFVANMDNEVLHTGRGRGYISSSTAQQDLRRKLPGVRVGGISMTGVKSAGGASISVTWATELSADAPPPPEQPDPYADARLFGVTTAEAGREVRIRMEGPGAGELSNFRISGRSSLVDGILTAITPFSFMVMTGEPFTATLTLQGEGQMNIETESEGQRNRLSVRAVTLSRSASREPLFMVRGNGSVASLSLPIADGLPAPELVPRR